MVASVLIMIVLSSLALGMGGEIPEVLFSNDKIAPRQGSCFNLCGNASVPYAQCATPASCGPVPGQACGCNCPACGSCVQKKNPSFVACQANVVLILDDSFSIKFFNATASVVEGAKAFWSSFALVNQIGGAARLAVVQFSSTAEIVNAGQPNLQEIKELDRDWLQQLNTYIDPTIPKAPPLTTYNPRASCDQPSCTNWGAALKLVNQTQWCVTDGNGICVPTKPDIVVWFTDGAPTLLDGTCDWNCNANSVLQGGPEGAPPATLGNGKGGDLGPACYWADQIKAANTRIFLIGVGQAANFSNEDNIKIVTGPTKWDPKDVDSFSTSDYVIDPNFENLAAIFFNVARGLCKCLQDQLPCENFVTPTPSPPVAFPTCPQQEQFDARLRVTTGENSHNYPANSRSYGWIYYTFSSQPPVYVVELQKPGSTFATVQNVVKSDLYDACAVQRKEICVDGCFAITDKSFLPRFFLSANDTFVNGTISGLTSSCGALYKKYFAPAPESIEYIWLNFDPATNTAAICAGRALDGTLYEFFRNNDGSTPGVNLRTPVHLSQSTTELYDFNQFDQCAAIAKCSSSLEVLYVVDRNFSRSDWVLVKEYVVKLMSSYDPQLGNIKGGYYMEGAVWPFNTDTSFDPMIRAFADVTNTPNQAPDFQRLVTNAINAFWPNNATDVPRYMITIVGGPSSAPFTPAQITEFKLLKRERGVESWAVGVAAGAGQINIVNAIGDLVAPSIDMAAYDHVQYFGSARILDVSVVDQAIRMCATQSLCDPTCQGLCVCGVCECADCVTPDPENLCETACCEESSVSKLCTVTKKEQTFAPYGCLPRNFDQCTKYSCEPTSGNCTVDATCSGSCGCASTSKCNVHQVNTSNCGAPCDLTPVVCGCGNSCGASCNEETGLCDGGEKVCNDNNACSSDLCIVENIGGRPNATCLYRNDSQRKCPTEAGGCSVSMCVSINATAFSCSSRNISALLDFCGTCNGNNTGCFFVVPTSSVGPIIGSAFAAGLVIAAMAAAIAALLALNRNKAPSAVNPLQDQALNDNPAFVAPGIAGEMPAA